MTSLAPVLASPQKRAAVEREERRRRIAEHPVGRLPFVHTPPGENGRDFWSVNSTGNYEQDYLLGEAFGRRMVAYIWEHDRGETIPHGTLGSVVRDMVRKGMGDGPLSVGDGGGIILGFMRVISQAIAGDAPRRHGEVPK